MNNLEKPIVNNALSVSPISDFLASVSRSPESVRHMVQNFQADLFRSELNVEMVRSALNAISKDTNRVLEETGGNLGIFWITEIRFRTPKDIRQALVEYYKVCHRLQIPLVYILVKESGQTSLYMGSIRKNRGEEERVEFASRTTGLSELLPGFLPGTKSMEFDNAFSLARLRGMDEEFRHRRVILGTPGEPSKPMASDATSQGNQQSNKDERAFGVERILDAVPEDFVIVGYSEPIPTEEIQEDQAIFSEAHDLFHICSKVTKQLSKAVQDGINISISDGISDTTSDPSHGTTVSSADKGLGGAFIAMAKRWVSGGEYVRIQKTTNQPGTSHTHQRNETEGKSHAETIQGGITIEQTNELARLAERHIARQLKRLETGLACGMWRHTTQVAARSGIVATKIAEILCGHLNGVESIVSQPRFVSLPDESTHSVSMFDLGRWNLICDPGNPLGPRFRGVSTALTSYELSRVASLPFHEVPGLLVEQLADYGRNYPLLPQSPTSVSLGVLVDYEHDTGNGLHVDFSQLLRHTFVTGATGSGKSTTMRHVLRGLAEKKVPFLVIEPVKREYRELKKWIPDLNVITLGGKDGSTSLNPFDFYPELGLVPHIDNLKAAFNATMGNYSSMPFILEDMIYRAYETKNCDEESLIQSQRLRDAGFPVFEVPIMGDLLPLVTDSIANFFPNQSDYGNSLLGALRARISSMTRGAKGAVLNSRSTETAINMETLLSSPCVIELWPFTDNEEKAFVMALLLIKLYEYRQKQDLESPNRGAEEERPLNHVLVVEEAHRLLSKPVAAAEHTSTGKQKSVEFFADMLAEIRSYGQGIMVVDQIPSKLVPDVIKNTDVKIAHRLTDKEDRDVLGGAMNLTPEQSRDLGRLKPGDAVVYFGGLRQALKIRVPLSPDSVEINPSPAFALPPPPQDTPLEPEIKPTVVPPPSIQPSTMAPIDEMSVDAMIEEVFSGNLP